MPQEVRISAQPPPQDTLAGHSDESKARRLVRAIPGAVILVSIVIAAIAMAGLWNNNLRESQVELDHLSLSAAKQTQWQIDRLDKLLQAGAGWLARLEEVKNIADLRLYDRFQPRLQPLEFVESVIISNSQGTLRVITRDVVAVPATAYDPRPLFALYQTNPDADLIVGKAFWLQSGKTWAFPISRRVLDPTGKLVGAITALLRADAIADRFNSIKPDESVAVLLVNGEGQLLAGRADENNALAAEPETVNDIREGFFEYWQGLSAGSYLANIRDLNGYPLHLVAAQSRLVYQAKFRGQALLLVGIAVAAGAGLASIAGILGGRVLAAHRRLREERDFVDTVMDSTDAIVLVIDGDGAIVRHNATFQRMAQSLGIELPRSLYRFCVPENAERIEKALHQVGDSGRGDFEGSVGGAGDRQITIKWSISPLPRGSGAPGALVCFGFDITELRQSWQSLARTNAAMEHVLALAKAYYWVAKPNAAGDDLELGSRYYSPGAAEFYGCTPEELLSPTASIVGRFVHPDDRNAFMEAFRDYMKSDHRRLHSSFRLRRRDGSYKHCISVSEKICDAEGRVVELIGVEQDISERHLADAMLAESAVKLRRAHRLANLCFFTMDFAQIDANAQPLLSGFSDETLETLGYPAGELNRDPGTYFSQIVAPADRDRFSTEWAAFMAAPGTGGIFQHRIRRSDASERHVRMSAEKLSLDGRRTAQIVGVIQDVTDQRHRELDLLTAKREAEIANRAKTEFLANMSHELRTPLNAVIGFSQLIRDQTFGPVGDRYAGYAGDIYHSGMMLLDLINDILDLSRIETGKLRLSDDLISVFELVQDCAKVVSAAAKDGGVNLLVQHPDQGLRLKADQRAMKQILLNVLSNAVKFTPKGGSVTISAHVLESGALELRVADTGIGIDPTVIKDLFQPFRQADSHISREYGGTGLGLSISRSLALLHGGDVRLRSALGHGTTVSIELPAVRVLAPASADRKLA